MRLFHISDDPAIVRFEPRPARDGALKVWAIEERMVCNYLLPRDCPRVCFRATASVESHLLEGADAIVAIETEWLERVRTAVLYRYELPTASFALEDATAGYWTSANAVTPLRVDRIADAPERIAEAGARMMVLHSLWALHDEVIASGLDFSMIRMRNAAPR